MPGLTHSLRILSTRWISKARCSTSSPQCAGLRCGLGSWHHDTPGWLPPRRLWHRGLQSGRNLTTPPDSSSVFFWQDGLSFPICLDLFLIRSRHFVLFYSAFGIPCLARPDDSSGPAGRSEPPEAFITHNATSSEVNIHYFTTPVPLFHILHRFYNYSDEEESYLQLKNTKIPFDSMKGPYNYLFYNYRGGRGEQLVPNRQKISRSFV